MQQDLNKSFDIPLHDIKPIMEIQEYSFYYFLSSSLFLLMLVLGFSYLLYRWFKKRTRFNQRAENFKLLKKLNLNDTKTAAYAITSLGAIFKDDSPRHTQMYANITQRLELYKYKKEVDQFDSEVLGYIEVYRGMIDV
ncbi:MAG: hypothetical protein U9N33_07020 [Campylobacterota bacterium]|nr:hypothetical protein [Campylobacterota bacterium]